MLPPVKFDLALSGGKGSSDATAHRLRESPSCHLAALYGRIAGIKGRMVEMSLNIKNEATHRLIQELASLTGETMTGAVTEAVRERLERVRRERSDGLAERLLAIGRNCAARLKEPYRSAEHGDLLYGEDGMPQ
jgi:antitoxin VapB